MTRLRAHLVGLVTLVFVVALTVPAEAHRLKLFVSVEGMTLSGYAFFIGGGRPQDVAFVVKDANGTAVHQGRTDAEGAFAWTAGKPADYTLAVDTGDGHFAEEKIAADRFSPEASAAPTTTSTPLLSPVRDTTPPPPEGASVVAQTPTCPAPVDPALVARLTESAVDRAVARQLRPLIEAQDLAEGRLRFNDIMGGIGMIVGLAGLGAWGLSRRRERGGPGA